MDRNSIGRLLFIAAIVIGGYLFLSRRSGDSSQSLPPETYVNAPGFAPDVLDSTPAPPPPPAGEVCTIHGPRFEADLSTRGAAVTHFRLTDPKYAQSDAADMSTTPDIERWRNLRTLFRTPGTSPSPDEQVKYDRFEWKLNRTTPGGCEFVYEDESTRVVKEVTATSRPFELEVSTTVTNLSDAPKHHRMSIGVFAYRTNSEIKGKGIFGRFGRVSPFQTNLECARENDVKRLSKDASEFKSRWYSEPLVDRYAAIANYYFAQALVPLEAAPGNNGDKPSCDLLAEQWYSEGQKPDSDEAGDVYKAALVYSEKTLPPHGSSTYRQVAFFGPKERDVLAHAAGGWPRLGELINLGTFSFVGR